MNRILAGVLVAMVAGAGLAADWHVTPAEKAAAKKWMVDDRQRPVDPSENPVAVVPADMKLFLLIGQSNMAGRGKIEGADVGPIPDCLKLNRDCKWVPSISPIHFDRRTSGYGIADSFARAYLAAHPGERVGLIPCAVGGSSSATWSPEPGNEVVGANYRRTLERSRVAMKNGKIKAILWHQGESDCEFCKTQEGADRYVARLAALAAALRRELGLEGVPFLIGEIGNIPKGHFRTMNPVLRRAAAAIPNAAIVPAEDLTGHLPDGVHFDTPSYKILGERYFKAMEQKK